MSEKKDPSIDELVKIAQQEPNPEPENRPSTEMMQFIQDIGVEVGPDQVDGPNIYWIYRLWCKDLGKKPKSNYPFFKEFRKHFNPIMPQPHGTMAYRLKGEPFKLSEEQWWDMKKHYRMQRDIRKRKKEEKAKKKQSRESRS